MALENIYKKASLVMKPAAMKEGKLYSQQPHSGDGDFTFSRANGTQTRINKHGLIESVADNTPRLSYELDANGNVSECPTLLLEPTRTNLQVRSEDFDNAAWTKSNCTVSSNQITSPDGATTADRLTADTSTGNHYVQDVASGLSTSSEATLSVFVKKDEITQIELLAAQNTTPYTNWGRLTFDLDTLTTFQTPIGEYGYEDYGNGWIRLFITGTPTSTSAIIRFTLYKNDTSNWTGNDIDGFYLWGAQLEQGSYPTSYIPTEGSAAERTQDIIDNIGGVTVNSDFTYFSHIKNFDDKNLGNFPVQFFLRESESPFSYFRFLLESNERFYAQLRNNNTATTVFNQFSDTLSNLGDDIKLAFAKSGTNCKYYVNGSLVLSSTITDFNYSFDRVNYSAGNDQPTKLSQIMVFNEALSDSELTELTS